MNENATAFSQLDSNNLVRADNLLSGQYTSYALFARGQLGDQPGQPTTKYLGGWKALPDGVMIAPDQYFPLKPAPFITNSVGEGLEIKPFDQTNKFPFPVVELAPLISPLFNLPFIAFNSEGRPVHYDGTPYSQDVVISLTRGSIFYSRDKDGKLLRTAADVVETPVNEGKDNFNLIRIDRLTGRAKLERRELK